MLECTALAVDTPAGEAWRGGAAEIRRGRVRRRISEDDGGGRDEVGSGLIGTHFCATRVASGSKGQEIE